MEEIEQRTKDKETLINNRGRINNIPKEIENTPQLNSPLINNRGEDTHKMKLKQILKESVKNFWLIKFLRWLIK